jgi:hypothetical protein
VQLDSTVALPARIITGDDGMLGLTQAGTNITIAADSDVEIPAEAADGQLIARLVQRRGNVFYDVAHREAGTLRVETPFLVAVIKGTQFNVAAEEGGSTISLFQGRLEIKTPDGSNSVFINAGQIARRSSAQNAISVIGMNDVRVEAPRSLDAVVRNDAANDDAIQPRVFVNPPGARDTTAATLARTESASSMSDVANAARGIGANVDLGAPFSVARSSHAGVAPSVSASAGLGLGGLPASVGANLNAGTGSSSLSLGANAGVGAGGAPASVGTNLNVGVANSGASLGAGANLGTVTVDVWLGNNGLHLGTGGNANDNPGLHLGNGNGNGNGVSVVPPGKSHGHP